jgi:hypothetical protein
VRAGRDYEDLALVFPRIEKPGSTPTMLTFGVWFESASLAGVAHTTVVGRYGSFGTPAARDLAAGDVLLAVLPAFNNEPLRVCGFPTLRTVCASINSLTTEDAVFIVRRYAGTLVLATFGGGITCVYTAGLCAQLLHQLV